MSSIFRFNSIGCSLRKADGACANCDSDNVDYNELKNLIKVNTTRDQGQAISIPGQADTALRKFEDQFFNELSNQHDRVDLFVKSKADEITRRLRKHSLQASKICMLTIAQSSCKRLYFDCLHDVPMITASPCPGNVESDFRNTTSK